MVNVRGVLYENDAVKSDGLERSLALFLMEMGLDVDYPFDEVEDGRCRRGASHPDIEVKYLDEQGRRRRFILEVKSSACNLQVEGEDFLHGSRRVLYVPIIPDEACEDIDGRRVQVHLDRLEGFYFDNKSVFLKDIEEAGLIREGKIPSSCYRGEGGACTVAVKTFYNNSKQALVSKKKYLNLVDLMYQNSTSTLEDFIEALEGEDFSILD